MNNNTISLIWKSYKNYVNNIVQPEKIQGYKDLSYWRDEVFVNILTFFVPVSIIALIPGVYMSFANGLPIIGFADLFAFFVIVSLITQRRFSLKFRKSLFISIAFLLGVVLLFFLEWSGAGLLFLLSATIFSSIIYSSKAGFYATIANSCVCIFFALLIAFKVEVPFSNIYTIGAWIAISSNLVVLSLVCAKFLQLLLSGLEKSLNESKRLAANLTSILENTDAFIYSLDTEFRYITYNQALKDQVLKAYNFEIESGIIAFDFLHPSEAAFWKDTYSEALKGKPVRFEKDFNFANHYSSTSFSINPIIENSNVVGLSCFVVDITEQKLARQKIEKSEKGLKEAQAIANLGSWEFNLTSGAVIWSEEACRIYGLPVNENNYTYDFWLSRIHPDDLNHVLDNLKTKQSFGDDKVLEHRIILDDGTIKYVSSIAKFETDSNGNTVSISGIVHDLTKTKLANLEREKLTADLLRQNKGLEQFSYIISHNLRGPVVNIIGITDSMQNPHNTADEQQTMLTHLNKSVTRLDQVINDLNYILQVKNNINENRQVVLFSQMVDDISVSIDSLINEENDLIHYNFNAINTFLTVRSYLYSIFYNLITNSIKYRRTGVKPRIEISSSIIGHKLILLFKDNGLGIDLEKKGEQVFGLYKRFHTHIEGKGMGLYMTKIQVESLGGSISISSTINEGTTFRLEFELLPEGKLITE